ncbi:MAG: NlpC/P60 family protein [Oscillospiraceae bacterium]|nr:NlpC/P60 family protein [Oscillospiraceae bacterium]
MSKRSPRLLFTDEERAAPELKKKIRKADRRMEKLEKREAKIPKKKQKTYQYRLDAKTGKVKSTMLFEEVDKKRPASKLTHALEAAPGETVLATVHRELRKSEQDNAGVESAHKLEETAEGGYRLGRSAYRSHKLKPYRAADRAELRADKANLKALNREANLQNPQLASNPYSHWQQKQAIKKEYAAAKAGKSANKTLKASETTAKAARKATEETKKAGEFVARHKKGFLVIGAFALMLVMLLNVASSCSVLMQGGLSGVAISTYPCEDADMLAAEAQYCGMEAELQSKLDNYEATHDYDEYNFDLDEIQHDPYVLISAITALHGGEWKIDEVDGILQTLFDKQYILTETVTVEVRYRTETDTWTDSDGVSHSESYQVAYNYYICTVTLENFNLSHVPVYIMSQDRLSMYAMYMATLGNRPDLFPGSAYIGKYVTGKYEDYDIPPEALEDEQFAAMITEAEKYLGFPYVWGGSSPSTSFDCSGFVSWVINHSGWDEGRLGAQGLLNICTRVSPSEAKPGDLVFFEKTYDTTGASHVAIYVGNGMMIHCGDPIQYTSMESNYWQQHFLAFGRLPNPA